MVCPASTPGIVRSFVAPIRDLGDPRPVEIGEHPRRLGVALANGRHYPPRAW